VKALFLILLVVLLFQLDFASSNSGGYLDSQINSGLHLKNDRVQASSDPIIINESQSWNGDLVVNQTDTVIIQDCDFVVENGQIYVYGTLNITNSTVCMHASTRTKWITVSRYPDAGNFTMQNSEILGENGVHCDWGSHVHIFDSTSPRTNLDVRMGSDVRVCNSVLRKIYQLMGSNLLLSNSTFSGSAGSDLFVLIDAGSPSLTLVKDSNLSSLFITFIDYEGDVELQAGAINSLVLCEGAANFTVSDSYVSRWRIWFEGFKGKLLNSDLDFLAFATDMDSGWSGNFTLIPGFVSYMGIDCDSTPMVIENTTVNSWGVYIRGNDSIEFLNSEIRLMNIEHCVDVTLVNSNVTLMYANNNVSAFNTIITTASIDIVRCYSKLSLKDGFNDFFNLCLPEAGLNITLTDSTVTHWNICADIDSTTDFLDLAITDGIWYLNGLKTASLIVQRNRICSVYNSTLDTIECSWSATLVLVNCTVSTLYAYEDSNVTVINSTISTLVTDPNELNLTNSKLLLQLNIPFELTSEDRLTFSFSGEYDPPLPDNVKPFSRYVNITTAYSDYLGAQVRIFYDEGELRKQGVEENDLKIYCMEEESSSWYELPVQGINTTEHYVWADVTSFSCFAIGAPLYSVGGGGGRMPYMD